MERILDRLVEVPPMYWVSLVVILAGLTMQVALLLIPTKVTVDIDRDQPDGLGIIKITATLRSL